VDSPPLALRWSIVMQRMSFLNASIALMTAVGQLLTREFNPPGGNQEREAAARFLVANADVALLKERHGSLLQDCGRSFCCGRQGAQADVLSQSG